MTEQDDAQAGTPAQAVATPSASASTTVTFVFTDLEGSTRLLSTLRDGYGPLLEAYHELIAQNFGEHGGTQLDQAGDGLFYSFPSARRAVAAVAQAQLAMAQREWPSGAIVRARMGIHTGEATSRRTGYVGMDVHRAARIASAGHGAQTLLSGVTRDLVATDLPEGAALADLGEHWLKDLAQPEHLYQLNVEGLPQAFAPLKSLVTLPNNLPRHLNTFVGRREDVAEVRQLTTESPLVTLTGPGGVGKTRLCLQVAAEVLDSFADGAWLIELESLSDASLVAQQVAVALGISEAADGDVAASVLGHLRSREALLILDNCEHVIDACAQLANSLLRACPGLRILTTSREPLGVPGERLYPVRSLSVPHGNKRLTAATGAESEAVNLFVERAQAADPQFVLSDANVGQVVEICRRLDGIPLAIELAAARVRALTPQQIAERLDDRFRLLTGGSRTVMPRHQTLRAAIDWSFDLLPDEERIVLWRLSVFAGIFSLEAAEAVCAASDIERFEVIDHLSRLVEKSLVNRQGDHYRLLETVRGLARERSLEAGQSEAAFERHRDWYLKFVRLAAPAFFRGPESGVWLDRLEVEHDNLRAALAWSLNEQNGAAAALELAAGLWRFWEIRGYLVEGRQWLERVLAASPDEVSATRGDVLTAAGIMAANQGDHAAAVRYHEQSLALHEQLGNLTSIQFALNNLANAALHEGNVDRARELYERIIAIVDMSDPNFAFVLVSLADVIDRQGDYEGASERYEQAIAVIRTGPDIWPSAYALSSYGQAAARHGDFENARQRYEQALDVYRSVGDQRGEARVMTLLADLTADGGDRAAARELLYEALQIRCGLNDAPGICAALERFAQAATDADEHRATRILAAASALRERTGARLSMASQSEIDQMLARLQSALDADFVRVWQQGSAATVDDALRDAAAVVGR
jgi:predicted ATPase/class 3 adenylate cyclase/Tfp pilus assembly protein PilF